MLYPLSYGGLCCKGAGEELFLDTRSGLLTTPTGRLTANLTA